MIQSNANQVCVFVFTGQNNNRYCATSYRNCAVVLPDIVALSFGTGDVTLTAVTCNSSGKKKINTVTSQSNNLYFSATADHDNVFKVLQQ